jgi:tetratricopeptide (TPR) repeat protein
VAAVVSAQVLSEDPCQAGRDLFVQNNYLGAEPLLKQCLERSESLLALLPLTMITVTQERAQDGVEYGRRAVAVGPDNPNVRYWYGRALLLAGDAAGASAQWEEGLRLDTSHVGILEGMARLAVQQGQDAKAYNLLSQLRLQGVDDAWVHRLLSGLARRKGLWDQAAIHWRDVVQREGETEQNLLVLGEMTILAGKPEEAVEIFRHAVATMPSGAMYGGLGEAWFSLDQVDSAAVALKTAVELDPKNARNRFNLANALELLGDQEGASAQFQAYLQQSPQDPVGHFNYGVHLEHRGLAEEALDQVETAVMLDPEYIQAQVVLAQMYENLGRTDDAIGVLDDLEQLDTGAAGQLAEWRQRLQADQAEAEVALGEGKVHLLHIVTGDPTAQDLIREGLAAGEDFAALATRFSTGPTAVRGGDIGWVVPGQMVSPLREAIEALQPGATSPPVEAGGLMHVFKRIR